MVLQRVISRLQRSATAIRRLWKRSGMTAGCVRITASDIRNVLQQLSPVPPRLLMVHSSLSACGFVDGGAKAIVQVLRDWLATGTLAMPAHSYCYPDDQGQCRVFERAVTPSRVGVITETFRKAPGVVRSLHPTHSLVCQGPQADWLIQGHENCASPCGAGTPYEKLVQENAAVLMFGVTLDTYTLMHTAEAAAGVPYLYEPELCRLKFRADNSEVREYRMQRQDMRVERRFAEMDRWLEERGLLHRVSLGSGELLWLPQSGAVHQAVVSLLKEKPYFLVKEQAG